MSRKVLAKVSGISERYIAQLESGKGNVSIVLLRRVSDAMGAHLEDLIPATEPAPDWPVIRDLLRKATPNQIAQAKDILSGLGSGAAAQRRMSFAGIALIGLRGAGKSTLGKLLAKKIGWNFVELNKEIEAQNGLSVAEIIALYGQEGFRRMEQAALAQLLARNELMVLATGGGIVSEPLTFDLVLSSFYTIWLKAEPEEHMARVRGQGDLRPMADDRSAMAELRNILLSREPLYARASAVVDTAGLHGGCGGRAPDRRGRAGIAERCENVCAGLSRLLRVAHPDQEGGKQAAQYDMDCDARRNRESSAELHGADDHEQRQHLNHEISGQDGNQTLPIGVAGQPVDDAQSHQGRAMCLSERRNHRRHRYPGRRIEFGGRKQQHRPEQPCQDSSNRNEKLHIPLPLFRAADASVFCSDTQTPELRSSGATTSG